MFLHSRQGAPRVPESGEEARNGDMRIESRISGNRTCKYERIEMRDASKRVVPLEGGGE